MFDNDEKSANNVRKARIGRLNTLKYIDKYIERCIRMGEKTGDSKHWHEQALMAMLRRKTFEHNETKDSEKLVLLEKRIEKLEEKMNGKEKQ